ncbi:LLM class flavin-dependent oxidoreductase [Dactylosporangium sp. NPDC005572]|uniref:LLM class flavin-dependent oxidoreductase n=1 Tax=Dactylosporangium sp. NPDC005572 TaxID=3156889 RepID=UPI0033A33006
MNGLHFGILPTPIYGAETPYQKQLAEHRELVRAAEELGFDHMVCGQHFLGAELRYYQPVPYLTWLSSAAPTMTVVTGIILLSMANPVDMAEQVATLDVLTGGRTVFGVGLGYSEREFRAFGIDGRTKVRRFEEALSFIRDLWSGRPVNRTGRFWQVEDVLPAVQPTRPGGPPVWVGGQSEAAVRRAARLGDAWYAPPFPSHAGLAALRAAFLEERAAHGLPTDGAFPLRRELIVADTRREAEELARRRSALRYQTYRSWGLGGEHTPTATAQAGTGVGIDVEQQFIVGSPDECVDRLGALRDELGMTHFMFKAHWQGLPHADAMRQLERFGIEVLPKLCGSA